MQNQLDCRDPQVRAKYKKLFKECKTLAEFFILWADFYENKVCISSYFETFLNDPANKQATYELGQKFKEITLRGILPVDFQATFPYYQKGYIHLLVFKDDSWVISQKLNRYNNIIAFYYDSKSKDRAKALYVTYNTHPNDIVLANNVQLMLGKPYTNVGGTHGKLSFTEWVNDNLKKKIDDMDYLIIINPSFESHQDYIVDVLLEVILELYPHSL